jgi:hypothetical protein
MGGAQAQTVGRGQVELSQTVVRSRIVPAEAGTLEFVR